MDKKIIIFGLGLILLSSLANAITSDMTTAVAYYTMDNNAYSGSTMYDNSTNRKNNGTVEAGVTKGVAGQVGEAFDIDGSFATAGMAWNLNAYCVGLGVKGLSGQRVLFARGGYAWLYNLDNNKYLYANHWPTEDGVMGTQQISSTDWTHIVFSYDGTNITMYINGTYDNSSVEAEDIDTRVAFDIGSSSSSFNNPMDELIIFNDSCSQGLVTQMYQNWTLGQHYYATAGGGPPPVVDAPPINVTITQPLNGTSYNTNNISDLNNNIYIKFNHNDTNDATCTMNDTTNFEFKKYPQLGMNYSANSTNSKASLSSEANAMDNDFNTNAALRGYSNWSYIDHNFTGLNGTMHYRVKWGVDNCQSSGDCKLSVSAYNLSSNTWDQLFTDSRNVDTNNYQNDTFIPTSYFSNETVRIRVNLSTGGAGLSSKQLRFFDGSLYSNNSGVIINKTTLSNDFYNIKVECNRTATQNGTALVSFRIDTISPTITANYLLQNNKTVTVNKSIKFNINFSDNLELYSVNISLANGTILFNTTNIGSDNYAFNYSLGLGTETEYTMTARVCDAHTNNKISELKFKEENKGFTYFIEDNPWWFEDQYIRIYPKHPQSVLSPSTKKKADRYEFTLPRSEVYVIESNVFIDISNMQLFGGHLIIPDLGENGYWVDFVTDEATGYSIERKNKKKIEVTVYGLQSDLITFRSLGELNCYQQVYKVAKLNPIERFTSPVLVGSSSTYYLNTSSPSIISSLTATLVYNNTNYTDSTANFTASVTAPSTITGSSENITHYWIVNADNQYFNLSIKGQNVSDFFVDNCTTYTKPTLNFTLLNITSGGYILGTMEFLFDYSLGTKNKNYSTSVIDYNHTFCIFPEWAEITSDIQIDYSSGDSATFSNFYNNTLLDNQSENINLYITDGTTQVTFTVYDETDQELQDVYISIYEFDVGTNQYKLSQTLKTDSEGQAVGNVVLNSIWYKFVIVYQGRTYLETERTKLTATTKDFRIVVGTTPASIIEKVHLLDIALTKNKATKDFNLTWNAIGNTASEIWFNVTTSNMTHGLRTLYSFSSSSASGTDGYRITEVTTNQSITYRAIVEIVSVDDGEIYFVTSDDLVFSYAWDIFGDESTFAAFLFIGTMAFIGLAANPIVALLLSLIGTMGAAALGLVKLSLAGIGSLAVSVIILMIKARRGNL